MMTLDAVRIAVVGVVWAVAIVLLTRPCPYAIATWVSSGRVPSWTRGHTSTRVVTVYRHDGAFTYEREKGSSAAGSVLVNATTAEAGYGIGPSFSLESMSFSPARGPSTYRVTLGSVVRAVDAADQAELIAFVDREGAKLPGSLMITGLSGEIDPPAWVQARPQPFRFQARGETITWTTGSVWQFVSTVFPVATIVTFMVACGVTMLVAWPRAVRATFRMWARECPRCGYAGQAGVCPECGLVGAFGGSSSAQGAE